MTRTILIEVAAKIPPKHDPSSFCFEDDCQFCDVVRSAYYSAMDEVYVDSMRRRKIIWMCLGAFIGAIINLILQLTAYWIWSSAK